MSLSGKTVLVTGATGFLGGALALRLASDGAHVRALARRPEKGNFLSGNPNIEIVSGDINDLNRMREVTEGCEYLFHVAAALGGPMTFQYHVNVEGTRNIMEAAVSARVKRVVNVSSIAAYGYEYQGDITEDLPLRAVRVPYNVTKMQGETVIREMGERHNLEYSIIRPAMIYGPRSNMWTKTMFQLGKSQPTWFLGDGSGSFHPIYVDDVVDMLVVLATHPQAAGEAFNCAPDPASTWREFIGAYSRLAGHERWRSLPVLPIRLAAPLVEVILSLRGEPQQTPKALDYLLTRRTYKMTKARERLGWQPQVDLPNGIQRCVHWLKEQGLLS